MFPKTNIANEIVQTEESVPDNVNTRDYNKFCVQFCVQFVSGPHKAENTDNLFDYQYFRWEKFVLQVELEVLKTLLLSCY